MIALWVYSITYSSYFMSLLFWNYLGLCRALQSIDNRHHFRGLGALRTSELWSFSWVRLSMRIYFYEVMLNPLLIARIMLKKYMLDSSMYTMPVHLTGYNLPLLFWYTVQSPQSDLVVILLFPVFTIVFTSRMFFMFLIMLTMCDVDPEWEMNLYYISLLIVLFFTWVHHYRQ